MVKTITSENTINFSAVVDEVRMKAKLTNKVVNPSVEQLNEAVQNMVKKNPQMDGWTYKDLTTAKKVQVAEAVSTRLGVNPITEQEIRFTAVGQTAKITPSGVLGDAMDYHFRYGESMGNRWKSSITQDDINRIWDVLGRTSEKIASERGLSPEHIKVKLHKGLNRETYRLGRDFNSLLHVRDFFPNDAESNESTDDNQSE